MSYKWRRFTRSGIRTLSLSQSSLARPIHTSSLNARGFFGVVVHDDEIDVSVVCVDSHYETDFICFPESDGGFYFFVGDVAAVPAS